MLIRRFGKDGSSNLGGSPTPSNCSLLLTGAVDVPKRPFAAIVGGSKVSSKISVIEAMLSKVRL